MERWTVDDYENGITKAINGKGDTVCPTRITDPLILAQGVRFVYNRPSGYYDHKGRPMMTSTWVDNDGKLLKDHDTVLDLFKIN